MISDTNLGKYSTSPDSGGPRWFYVSCRGRKKRRSGNRRAVNEQPYLMCAFLADARDREHTLSGNRTDGMSVCGVNRSLIAGGWDKFIRKYYS